MITLKIMKRGFYDHSPRISLTVLGTLCFVTLIMCQTRFKITKELHHDIYPPVLRSKDCWFLYTIGSPNRFKCVLKAFVVITSPILSFISTALLLFGKMESNPYFFIPWLFLTIKGLLLVQTDNIITILRDIGNRANNVFGFRMEDVKWLLFYGTIFMIDLVEAFSFCEIFDLFLVLWNHHPGYNVESMTLEAVRKEIADIMDSLSKCSLGSLSKVSLGSITESDKNSESNPAKEMNKVKFSAKEEERIFDENEPTESLLKCDASMKSYIPDFKNDLQFSHLRSVSEVEETATVTQVIENSATEEPNEQIGKALNDLCLMNLPKLKEKPFGKADLKESSKNTNDCFPLESFRKEFHSGVM